VKGTAEEEVDAILGTLVIVYTPEIRNSILYHIIANILFIPRALAFSDQPVEIICDSLPVESRPTCCVLGCTIGPVHSAC
jgi:hypothetical protein